VELAGARVVLRPLIDDGSFHDSLLMDVLAEGIA